MSDSRLRPMTQFEIVDALVDLGAQAEKLRSADAHNAEAFMIDKTELVQRIYELRDGVRLGVRGS